MRSFVDGHRAGVAEAINLADDALYSVHMQMAVSRYFAVWMGSTMVATVLLAIAMATPAFAVECQRSSEAKEVTVVYYSDAPMTAMELLRLTKALGQTEISLSSGPDKATGLVTQRGRATATSSTYTCSFNTWPQCCCC